MDMLFAFPAILLAIAVLAIRGPGRDQRHDRHRHRLHRRSSPGSPGPACSASARRSTCGPPGRWAPATCGSSRRHVLPNVATPIIVQTSISLAFAILAEAALSFIGLGTQPPEPVVGADAGRRPRLHPPTPGGSRSSPASPSSCRCSRSTCVGDALRDALDPRQRSAIESVRGRMAGASAAPARRRRRRARRAGGRRPGVRFAHPAGHGARVVNGRVVVGRAGRDAGHRRRVRQRQERERAWRCWAWCPARRATVSPAGRASTGRTCWPCSEEAPAQGAGAGHRHGVPGPDDLAQPGAHRRAAAHRGHAGPPRAVGRRPPRTGRPSCSTTVGIPSPRGAAARLPPPALRRDAPAGHDRHRPVVRPRRADRRRGDDRPRRHDPGPDRRADRRACRRELRHGGRLDHPRPRRRGRASPTGWRSCTPGGRRGRPPVDDLYAAPRTPTRRGCWRSLPVLGRPAGSTLAAIGRACRPTHWRSRRAAPSGPGARCGATTAARRGAAAARGSPTGRRGSDAPWRDATATARRPSRGDVLRRASADATTRRPARGAEAP